MTPAEKNLQDILHGWKTFAPRVAPKTVVKVVACPHCQGEGTTAGAMSYGSNLEACETCRHCGGRGLIEKEIYA